MGVELQTKFKGLHTSANEIGGVIPEGSLSIAENVILDNDALIEVRRGYRKLPDEWSNNTFRTYKLISFDDHLHAINTNKEYRVWDTTTNTWNLNDSLNISRVNVDTTIANKNLYILTDTGLVKHQKFNVKTEFAGVPKAINMTTALDGVTGFLLNDTQVAYRIVWFVRDSNNNLVLGGASERALAVNTSGGARNVQITSIIPVGITEGFGYQIYRSASVNKDITPNDTLQIIFESAVTTNDVNNGFIQVVDTTPDSLRGATIYTAGTQEGLANNNDVIPLAQSMAEFNGTLFLGNVSYQHRAFLDLLGVDAPNGLQLNDTITIAGDVYTAKASTNISNREFTVTTTGTPSQNVQATMQSLINVVNSNANNNTYGFYLSGLDDLPGKAVFERRLVSQGQFTITVSRASAWNVKTATSSDDKQENRLVFSKPNQPEHFSLVNSVLVGTEKILKLMALREALLIFTTDGIYRLSGTNPGYSVELLDSSAILIAPATCDILNNDVYCLTTQGVTIVSSQGVKIVSRPIEDSILKIIKTDRDRVANEGFAISSETDRRYHLFLPESPSSSVPDKVFVYNVFTSSWVNWVISANCGAIHNDRIYYGNALQPTVMEQQKNFTKRDYADYFFDVTRVVDGNDFIEVVEIPSFVAVNDIIYQSDDVHQRVLKVDEDLHRIYFDNEPQFTETKLQVHNSIPVEIENNPIYEQNPSSTKQWIRGHLYFKEGFTGKALLTFVTDIDKTPFEYPLEGFTKVAWGGPAWGTFPWGGEATHNEYFSLRGMRGGQIFIKFNQRYAYAPFQAEGYALQTRQTTTLRFRRP